MPRKTPNPPPVNAIILEPPPAPPAPPISESLGRAGALLTELKNANQKLKETEKVECKCDSFTFQYEGGCTCAHGRAVKKAQDYFNVILKHLLED